MSYTGISTREAKLAELLERAWFDLRPDKQELMNEIREALDAKCGIYATKDASIGTLHPACQLRAGHSGPCNPEAK